MKINISKRTVGIGLMSLALTLGIGGTTAYHYMSSPSVAQITSPTQVNACSSLYQSVRHNDLHYLHKIGNRKAELANAKAGISQIHGSNAHYGGKYPIYHHDKYGNYWSYFEDHSAIMPSDPNFDSSEYSEGPTNSNSGILANEKVLENHGVHSGVNFSYWEE